MFREQAHLTQGNLLSCIRAFAAARIDLDSTAAAMKGTLRGASDHLERAWHDIADYSRDTKRLVIAGAALAVVSGAFLLRPSRYNKKPGTRELGGGSIERAKIKHEMDEYTNSYGKGELKTRDCPLMQHLDVAADLMVLKHCSLEAS